MEPFNVLLILHIVSGGASILLGLFVLFSRKGNRSHKRVGLLYFYAMLTSALLGLPMSIMHSSYFLFIIGVFTAYMLLTGRRYLKKKKSSDVKWLDWILTTSMLLFGLAFIFLGVSILLKPNLFGIVFCVFGGFSLLFVFQDYSNFRNRSSIKNYWLTTHIQRMVGSYIATVTAFLVVNNKVLPDVVAWLLPTALLVPLIIIWTRRHQIDLPTAAIEGQ